MNKNNIIPIIFISFFFTAWIGLTSFAFISAVGDIGAGAIPLLMMSLIGIVVYILMLRSILKSNKKNNQSNDENNNEDTGEYININNVEDNNQGVATVHLDCEDDMIEESDVIFEYQNSEDDTTTAVTTIKNGGVFLIFFGIVWTSITSLVLVITLSTIDSVTKMIIPIILVSGFIAVGVFLIIIGFKTAIENKSSKEQNTNNNINNNDDDFFVKYCTECGESLKKTDKICPSCGAKVNIKK